MDNIVDNPQTKEKVTYEDIRAKLLDLSANKAIAGNSKTAYRIQKSSISPKTIGNEKKDCTWCRKRKMRSPGHTWNECRKLKAHNAKQKEEKGKEEKAQQVSQTKPEEPSTYATAFQVSTTPASKHKPTRWIFDTGTSSHMAPNKDLFIPNSFKPCSGTTRSAHGGIRHISRVGDIRLKCRRRSGGMGYSILRDVVLDEGLEENLFSYLSVIGKGFKLQGEGDDVWLEDKKGDEVLWAKREGKDIVIQCHAFQESEAIRFVSY